MSDPLTYCRTFGRFVLEVEPNTSRMNESRVVLRNSSTIHGSPMGRFTVEELHDLHYVTGRAIAALELEQK